MCMLYSMYDVVHRLCTPEAGVTKPRFSVKHREGWNKVRYVGNASVPMHSFCISRLQTIEIEVIDSTKPCARRNCMRCKSGGAACIMLNYELTMRPSDMLRDA